jgi:hypothetical protein
MRGLSAEPEPLGPAGTRLDESSFGDLVLARLGAAVLRAKNLALLWALAPPGSHPAAHIVG